MPIYYVYDGVCAIDTPSRYEAARDADQPASVVRGRTGRRFDHLAQRDHLGSYEELGGDDAAQGMRFSSTARYPYCGCDMPSTTEHTSAPPYVVRWLATDHEATVFRTRMRS